MSSYTAQVDLELLILGSFPPPKYWPHRCVCVATPGEIFLSKLNILWPLRARVFSVVQL